MQIKKFFFIILCIFISATNSTLHHYHKEYTIILDPAGDAKKTGRAIGDSFERGLTLQCAEYIKSALQERASHIKVIISRLPGDHVYELQNASLSNRLNVDLFLNLNFYHTQETKPSLFVYSFSYGNDFAHYQPGLTFNTYDEAHKINKTTTTELALLCTRCLTQHKYSSLFSVSESYALPIKPLIGIIAPSLCIEVGLKNKDSWRQLVEPLVESIMEMIEYLDSHV